MRRLARHLFTLCSAVCLMAALTSCGRSEVPPPESGSARVPSGPPILTAVGRPAPLGKSADPDADVADEPGPLGAFLRHLQARGIRLVRMGDAGPELSGDDNGWGGSTRRETASG